MYINKEEPYRTNYREFNNAPLNKDAIKWQLNNINAYLHHIAERYDLVNDDKEEQWFDAVDVIQNKASIAGYDYCNATYKLNKKGEPVLVRGENGKYMTGNKEKWKNWWHNGPRDEFITKELKEANLE